MPHRTTPRPRPTGPVAVAAVAALSAVVLGGCTAISGGTVTPVTVTVTPTVTITPSAAGTTSATPSASPSSSAAIVSDDKGNNHDLGKILEVKDEGGTKVIVFDRYRRSGTSSARLFRDGIELTPHRSEVFRNPSSQQYSIPVTPDATFVKQTCVSPNDPAQNAASTLDEMAALSGREAIVLLDLDADGWVTRMTSDPVCL